METTEKNAEEIIAKKLIKKIKRLLSEEKILTAKDEITLKLLENTYISYLQSIKKISETGGQCIETYDYNRNKKIVINPFFKNSIDLQKELEKLTDSLYLNPKSRKSKIKEVKEKSGLSQMIDSINSLNKDE